MDVELLSMVDNSEDYTDSSEKSLGIVNNSELTDTMSGASGLDVCSSLRSKKMSSLLNPDFQVARNKEVVSNSKLNDNYFAGWPQGQTSTSSGPQEAPEPQPLPLTRRPIKRPAAISRPVFICTELTSRARPAFGSSASRSESAPVGFQYSSDCECIVIYNITETRNMQREQGSASSEDGADESDSQRATSATPTEYEAVSEDNASESEQEEEEGKAGVAGSETESDTEGEHAGGQESAIHNDEKLAMADPHLRHPVTVIG
ncbi:hypothetical protein B0H14DRAFT_2645566 [Mycena olivaceomarginata]|nr:hypothetical protein B0H14DRAFT_2645566 [Mycena olivaceomarginata]